MDDLFFFVPGRPQTAGSKTPVTAKNGKSYLIECGSKELRKKKDDWRGDLRDAALRAIEKASAGIDALRHEWPKTCALEVYFTFYRARPSGHYGRKSGKPYVKPSADPYPIQRPDVLKLARAAEDALTGILWADDSQIVREVLEKRWADDTYGPGLLIRVSVCRHPTENCAAL